MNKHCMYVLNVHKKQLEKQLSYLLCRSRHIRKIFALEGSELYGHVLFCFIDVFPNTKYAFFTYKVPNSGGCLVFSSYDKIAKRAPASQL